MGTYDANHRRPDALAEKAEAAVAQMTEVVRNGKEQIKRLHKIIAKIESLESAKL
jgi:uncharacterized protein Yka (UPF0111/DUF47 family)